MDGGGKLLAGEIFFTNPRSNHRQILDHDHAVECVLFHGKKLNPPSAFLQGLLFPPESSVDDTERTPCRAVIWLSLYDFLLLYARSSKSQLRLMFVICHARDNAFGERARE